MPTLTKQLEENDLSDVELRLNGLPEFDYFSVLIKDLDGESQYWFRKMGVKVGSENVGERVMLM